MKLIARITLSATLFGALCALTTAQAGPGGRFGQGGMGPGMGQGRFGQGGMGPGQGMRMQQMRAQQRRGFQGRFGARGMRGFGMQRGFAGRGPGIGRAMAMLDLTDAQQQQLKALREKHRAQAKGMFEQRREECLRVLTPDQRKKLEDMKAQMKNRLQNRRQGRFGPGNRQVPPPVGA